MSWSIEGDDALDKNPGLKSLANFMSASEVKDYKHPLMYWAAADDGTSNREGKKEYPHNCHGAYIFRIGAATDSGQTWMKVTDPARAHFFFPGVDVPDLMAKFQYQYESFANDPDTNSGSSIATALAAGLAALILPKCRLPSSQQTHLSLSNLTLLASAPPPTSNARPKNESFETKSVTHTRWWAKRET